MSRRKTEPAPATSRHQVPDSIPAAAPRPGFLRPQPEEPAPVVPTWEVQDQRVLDLCGRLGLHPVELMALRFGEPDSMAHGEDLARFLMRQAGPLPGETLGATLLRLGFTTAEESDWLDRGLKVTEVKMRCHELVPLDRWDLNGYDEPLTLSAIQRLSRFRCFARRFWRADKDPIPELPRNNEEEPRSDLLARAHRAVLDDAAERDRQLTPAQALAEAHDVVTTLGDRAVMNVVVKMAREMRAQGGNRA